MHRRPAPKFDNPAGWPAMMCPSCGGTNLHHDEIEIFDRREDAEHGLHVSFIRGEIKIDTSMLGNPSSRRNGLTVGFWCETCQFRTILTIEQHKGTTFVYTGMVKAEPAF